MVVITVITRVHSHTILFFSSLVSGSYARSMDCTGCACMFASFFFFFGLFGLNSNISGLGLCFYLHRVRYISPQLSITFSILIYMIFFWVTHLQPLLLQVLWWSHLRLQCLKMAGSEPFFFFKLHVEIKFICGMPMVIHLPASFSPKKMIWSKN